MQRCEAPLIQGMISQEEGDGGITLSVKGEGIAQGLVQPEFDGQVEGRHTLLVGLIVVDCDEAGGSQRDDLLAKMQSLVLKSIILEQGEEMMQNGVTILVSDVERKWGLGLIALDVLFNHLQDLGSH
jgi:hypothetical protein